MMAEPHLSNDDSTTNDKRQPTAICVSFEGTAVNSTIDTPIANNYLPYSYRIMLDVLDHQNARIEVVFCQFLGDTVVACDSTRVVTTPSEA